MEKLFKRFMGLVTKWKVNYKVDEFFVARLRLTFYYSLTAIIILGGSSLILYNTILTNFSESIGENLIDSDISQVLINRAQDILLNRFLTIDAIIVFFIIILGFFLTQKTLKPIKINMQKQKRFIADASHELRTPIAVIMSGLEVTLRNKKIDLPLAKETIENTLNEMKDFSSLSNNLLDISKYDMPSQLNYENINISELVKSVVEKSKNLAKIIEINIEDKIESNAIVWGSKDELCRVFNNIIDNAIKYNSQNGKILVSDKIIFNKYILTITDSGIGIDKDNLSKIFDPFFRGDVSRSTNGAGLGLTLSKKIIENHRGSISVKSQINKGTSVIISLPISS